MDSYETYELWWRGQKLILRWCADSFVYAGVGHMELLTEDRSPHPISQTGYRSHFIPRHEVENIRLHPVGFPARRVTRIKFAVKFCRRNVIRFSRSTRFKSSGLSSETNLTMQCLFVERMGPYCTINLLPPISRYPPSKGGLNYADKLQSADFIWLL